VKVFAISDLHLSFGVNKPMNLFGEQWDNYEERIMQDWNARVGADDVGIIAGDISWAMRVSEAEKDFEFIRKLNGTKIVVRGNHDYWWSTVTKANEALGDGVHAIQAGAVQIGNIIFAGTRGWRVPERRGNPTAEDKKILNREVIRFELALKDAVAKKGNDTEVKIIAILHYPPFNATVDQSAFTDLCEKYGVVACVYGHLHGKQRGQGEFVTKKNGVTYYLTSCDLLGHKLVEVDF